MKRVLLGVVVKLTIQRIGIDSDGALVLAGHRTVTSSRLVGVIVVPRLT
jgi:hypothetical protein